MSAEYVIGRIEKGKLYYFSAGSIVTDYAEASKYKNVKHADQVHYFANKQFSNFQVMEICADSIMRIVSEMENL